MSPRATIGVSASESPVILGDSEYGERRGMTPQGQPNHNPRLLVLAPICALFTSIAAVLDNSRHGADDFRQRRDPASKIWGFRLSTVVVAAASQPTVGLKQG
jgi:hypothetical protein